MKLIRQWASDYLNKDCNPRKILEAIRTSSLSCRYLTPVVADLLVQELNRSDDAPPPERLSERELHVFMELAQGAAVKDIGSALSLATSRDGLCP